MQTFWTEAEYVPQHINRMEAAQKKFVRTPLPVNDAFIQAINFRSILASGEYPDKMRY